MRTKVIVQMNRAYLCASAVLVVLALLASRNRIEAIHPGPGHDGLPFKFLTFAVASYCMSRAIEVVYSFYRDAFDRLARKDPDSDLDGRRRIGLALASYVEMIMNFGLLLALAPQDAWQNLNANQPTHVSDVLFYSASTITTSGGGGFLPKGALLQVLTVFEIACGLVLLVVCFAVYADDPVVRQDGAP